MVKKILVAIAITLALLIGLVAIAAFTAPTDFRVEREITINKPAHEIYAYAKLIKNQNAWGPWYKKEPTMQQEFRGTDGEVGFVSHWKGTHEEVGEGEQEIKRLTENRRIDTELRFIKPFESKADAYLNLEPLGERQTKVKWGFTTSVPRPMNAIMLVMDMDAAVGKDFAEGLASLKTIMESK